jgi:hypothetical protein
MDHDTGRWVFLFWASTAEERIINDVDESCFYRGRLIAGKMIWNAFACH